MGEKRTADYLAEERFKPGELVVVQAGESLPEELAEIIAVAQTPFYSRNPKKVLRAYREGEPLWKPLRGHPLRGYAVYEEASSSDPAFEKYFSLVREKANSLNSVFFIQAGDGHDLEEDGMRGEDLWGWLIPISLADRFENLWAHGYREGEWDEDYFCCAEWRKTNDRQIEIRFIDYGEDGEPVGIHSEAPFRTFYRVVFRYGSQEYTYLGSDTDNVFEMCFTPLPGAVMVWDTVHNPYAKYLSEMAASTGPIVFTWNMPYNSCTNFFEYTFEDIICEAFHRNKNPENREFI